MLDGDQVEGTLPTRLSPIGTFSLRTLGCEIDSR